MVKGGWVLFIVGLLISCSEDTGQPMDNPTQIDKYFPLKDFVENQIGLLDGSTVKKTLCIQGKIEETQTRMDAEAWRKELDIFIQSDINKASLAMAYETEEADSVTIHRLKPGEKSSIKEITVLYEDEQVRWINFKAFQDEFFYRTLSEGELVVDKLGRLRSYQVKGTQNVWFLSPNEMVIKGVVLP